MKKLMNWISRIVPKRSEEKNELLQSYFTSLASLVLCLTMFFGTTYAWFTSEVTNQANEIYIGVLDVELEKQVGEEWKSLSAVDAQGVNTTKLFDGSIRWEPGYTALETVRVVNEGELSFKYVLQFTDGSAMKKDEQNPGEFTDVDAQTLAAIAEHFDVWVYNHISQEKPEPDSFADINEANGWINAGSLADLLAGAPVFQGEMEVENTSTQAAADENETGHTYTIALHMKEEADASVMGHKISLNVKLIAYQAASETDDFGNSDFDNVNMTFVYNADGLRNAVQNAKDGDIISIAAGNYDLTDEMLVVDKAITLMGSDSTDMPVLQFVTGDGTGGTNDIVPGIEIKSDNVTLKNLKLAVDPNGISSGYTVRIPYKAADSTEYYSNIMIDGCAFSGSDHCIAMLGNNVTIQNCVLNESTAADQGTIIYVWGTSGKLTIKDNEFIGNSQTKHGISFLTHPEDDVVADAIAGDIIIEGNTFEDVRKCIVHESNMTYTDVTVQVLNNHFESCRSKPVAIDEGSYLGYLVNGNVFGTVTVTDDPLIDNKAGAAVNADCNYWGSANPVWDKVITSDKITVNNYYTDAEMTQLVTKN